MLAKHPERILEEAIKRDASKTKLGKAMVKKLKVYAGASHPHSAQKPEVLSRQQKFNGDFRRS